LRLQSSAVIQLGWGRCVLLKCRTATIAVGSGVLALAVTALAARSFAGTSVPLSNGAPSLLVAVCLLLLVGYALKVLAWRRLFTVEERPHALALVAATAGASIAGLVLPGRVSDLLRIAIVRRSPSCPAGVRSLCLSLVMLGLIDSAALAPFALAAAILPGYDVGLRFGLALVAVGGIVAAALIVVLPRLAANRKLLRYRVGRWLSPRTSSLRNASAIAALLSVGWVFRAAAAMLLLSALGVGFSFSLAVLFLCAGKAAAALPGGQAGAGGAVLIASGVGGARALDVAVSGQALAVLCGVAMLAFAAVWLIAARLMAANALRRPLVLSPLS
jgi:lysylphosphatidylglycerol synthase-like protein